MMKKSLFWIVSIILCFSMVLIGCKKPKDPPGGEIPPVKPPYQEADEIDYNFENLGTYKNTIKLEEILGMEDEDCGDPFVMRYNGKFYLYPSSGGRPGVRVYISDDMVNWKYGGYATAENEPNTSGAYAPEVIYYNGNFYMCQSQGGNGHYIYKSDSPDKGFRLISKNLGRGIDGSFHIDDNGDLYIIYTGGANIDYSLISDIENLQSGAGIGSINFLKGVGLGGWTEGPGVFRRGDFSYITYTGNHVLSSGYRIAYSYAKNKVGLDNQFVRPDDHIVMLKTGNIPQKESKDPLGAKFDVSYDGNVYGLGHNSNVVGRDLDSLYSAYHNLVYWINGTNGQYPNERLYNMDRYLTNGRELMINGMTNYNVALPKKPDFENDGKDLSKVGTFALSSTSSEKTFTAEMNFELADGAESGSLITSFVDNKNYNEIILNADSNIIGLYSVENGIASEVKSAEIVKNNNFSALNTVRVESGYSKSHIYINNMRVLSVDKNLGGGKIGYGSTIEPQYTAFSNDVFGTSDFDAVKNAPTRFPAMSYIKGENRGFSIKNAKVKENGNRQGEKENSVNDEDRSALVLDTKGDYVKYAVNVGKAGTYAFEGELSGNSIGSIEVIIDNKTKTTFKIPDNVVFEKNAFEKMFIGKLELEKGNHVIKIRLESGVMEAVNFGFTEKAVNNLDFDNDLTNNSEEFFDFNENYTITDKGIKSSYKEASLLLYGNEGNANYKFALDYSLDSGSGSNGIVFRMNNFSETFTAPNWQITDAMQGYFLKVTTSSISLNKYNYDVKTRLGANINTKVFSNGKSNNIEIEAKQNRITVSLNGEIIIDVIDHNAFLSGQLGLYSAKTVCTATNFYYGNII